MSSFTTELSVSPLDDGKNWRLNEQFRYRVGKDFDNPEKIIVAPKNFITDFASIPRIFWVFFKPWGKHGKAAVIHDYLYRLQPCSRKEADDIFLDGMKVLKVNKLQMYPIYWAVKYFGFVAWNNNKKKLNK